MALSDYSTVAANNGTVLGVNLAENCPAANVNNGMRQLCADIASGINLSILGTFLSSSSLANARTALGVSGGSTSLNNFGAIVNTANLLPYMTGADAWGTTTLSPFMRTVLDDGDGTTALTTLGGVSVVASSIAAGSGYIKLNISGTTFIFQWVDFTAAGNTTTAVSFPTAFASWSRSWVNGANTDTDAQQNGPCVTTHGTTSATVTNAYNTAVSSTLFSWGV